MFEYCAGQQTFYGRNGVNLCSVANFVINQTGICQSLKKNTIQFSLYPLRHINNIKLLTV